MRLSAGSTLAVALLVTACAETTGSSCVEVREAEDPLSIQHLLDPDAAVFRTDPPTSGPHLAGPSVAGLLTEPIRPAAQVRVLEAGGVVVQYTSPDAVGELRTILDANEIAFAIAPADALPAPVIATAWTWKLTCETPDVARILDFAATRVADAPGAD